MNDYKFGNFVCHLREKKGLTQADIAEQLGITPAAVSKWENGTSKPRTEMLFKLAQILDVTPEELMAGEFLEKEVLSPEAIQKINERYEYLVRVESHSRASVKIRRLLAWLIDWNLIGFLVILFTGIVLFIFEKLGITIPTPILLIFILSYPALFMMRDFLFGRSIGKRIFGLVILDKQTGANAKPLKRLLRNLFLMACEADAIVMLISGFSIGDFVARTVVVPKKSTHHDDTLERDISFQDINSYSPPPKKEKKKSKKKTILIISAIVLGAVLFVGALHTATAHSLEKQKQKEEYQLAYAYFVESQKFKDLGIDENDIRFTSYSIETTTDRHGNKETSAKISFRVPFLRQINVICHKDANDNWYVCSDCTGFQ